MSHSVRISRIMESQNILSRSIIYILQLMTIVNDDATTKRETNEKIICQ